MQGISCACGHCPWEEDIEDARAVAEHLGIEFRVVNLMQDYRDRVVDYLLAGGSTLALTAACLALTVWLFSRERMLFGKG